MGGTNFDRGVFPEMYQWPLSGINILCVFLPLLCLTLTLALLNKLKDARPTSNFQSIRLLDQDCWYKFTYLLANSADPDQLASSEAD